MNVDIADSYTKIKVIGIGGMGINAINLMIDARLQYRMQNLEFIAMSTDTMELKQALAMRKILLEKKHCQGYGTGSNPDNGFSAAMESRYAIAEAIGSAEWVIIVAGLGNGTGSGASQVIAGIAAKLTTVVVTLPFCFENKIRERKAHIELQQLRRYADGVIVIPDYKIGKLIPKATTKVEYKHPSSIVSHTVTTLGELLQTTFTDFADVMAFFKESGLFMMGTGSGAGMKKAGDAARQAVADLEQAGDVAKQAVAGLLLENGFLDCATRVLLAIAGPLDLSFDDIDKVIDPIWKKMHKDVTVNVSWIFDENVRDELRVTVFVGIDALWPIFADKIDRYKNSDSEILNKVLRREDDDDKDDLDES
jgi:cell division protein FtsZ